MTALGDRLRALCNAEGDRHVTDTELGAVATELPATAAAEDGGPAWVQLLPAGAVRTRPHDGREPWRVSDANAVVAATRAIGLPLAIDYDHQSEFVRENGKPAPAAGWIEEVEARPSGIFGRVAWTEKASAMIRAHEYRFLSPAFRFDPKTREILFITMAGLTNDRALADLKAFASKEGSMDELIQKLRRILGLADDADQTAVATAAEAMAGTLKAIAKALGLEEDATPEELEAKAKATAEGGDGQAEAQALGRVAKALGLKDDATAEDVEKAAATATAKAAASGELGEVKAELKELKDERAEEKATAAVDKAISDGRLTPGQREWALGTATRDLDDFKAFVDKAPVVLAAGSRPKTPPATGDGPLTVEDKAVAKALGLKDDEFKASAKALAAAEAGEEAA